LYFVFRESFEPLRASQVNGLGNDHGYSELGLLWRASEHHLQLHPHGTNAAIGEVAIQETPWWCTEHISLRRVHELRMIEGIQRFAGVVCSYFVFRERARERLMRDDLF
jgi:hypothetical protein